MRFSAINTEFEFACKIDSLHNLVSNSFYNEEVFREVATDKLFSLYPLRFLLHLAYYLIFLKYV